MYKWKKWELWKRVKSYAEKKMTDSWMLGGNCDSRCPKCNQWESHGNVIITNSLSDGSEARTCNNCGHEWRAIFTPAGFIPVE